MDSTDTLPSIQLLSLCGVQLRTSFIGVNSFQRDSNQTPHVSLSHETYQNESSRYFFVKLRNKKSSFRYYETIRYGRR